MAELCFGFCLGLYEGRGHCLAPTQRKRGSPQGGCRAFGCETYLSAGSEHGVRECCVSAYRCVIQQLPRGAPTAKRPTAVARPSLLLWIMSHPELPPAVASCQLVTPYEKLILLSYCPSSEPALKIPIYYPLISKTTNACIM